MRQAFAWIKFDYTQALVPGQCLVGGISDRLVIRGVTPLAVMLLIILASILNELRTRLQSKPAPRNAGVHSSYAEASTLSQSSSSGINIQSGRTSDLRSVTTAAMSKALPAILILSFSLCPAVSAGIFSVWICERFHEDSDQKTTQLFMRDDLSIRCSAPGQGNQIYDSITSQAYM